MRIFCVAFACALLAMQVSPACAGVIINSISRGVSLDLKAYNADAQQQAHLSLVNPAASVAVPGAQLSGSSGQSFLGISLALDVATISATGFLNVDGVVTENGAAIFAWDVPPNSWLFVEFETSDEYDYVLSNTINNDSPHSSATMRLTEGGYFGQSLSSSGALPPGEYSLVFESAFELFGQKPGIYHAHQNWQFDLVLVPALPLSLPECSTFVLCMTAILAFSSGCRRRHGH